MKINKILFPTDFTGGNRYAAEYAADLVDKYDARLYLLHVIYDITKDTGFYGSRLDLDALYAEVKQSASDELASLESEIFASAGKVDQVVKIGSPADVILTFAEEEGIDLIVMGTHGRKVLDRMLFGSTAQRVVRRAHSPVLTVREP